MKIVITDGYTENPGDLSYDGLKKYGELTVYDRTAQNELLERIKDANIVITNKVELRKDVIDKLDNLKFVELMSTGYNVVDYDYLKTKGIPVSNIPAYSTEGVAQLVMAFILEFAIGVGEHTESVKKGEWASCPDFCYWKKPIFELSGKTLGIFGFGRIGRAVAKRADAFGMKVLFYTPRDHGNYPDYAKRVSLDDLLSNSDIITMHCPLVPETHEIVNSEFISKMKDGAYLINTSRGPVINENDVSDALKSGKLSGAAFDVLSSEPPKKDNPLVSSPNTFITPHIAWAAYETRKRLLDILTRNIEAFINGKPENVVNL